MNAIELKSIADEACVKIEETSDKIATKVIAEVDQILKDCANDGLYSTKIPYDNIKKIIKKDVPEKVFLNVVNVVINDLRKRGFFAMYETNSDTQPGYEDYRIAVAWYEPKDPKTLDY